MNEAERKRKKSEQNFIIITYDNNGQYSLRYSLFVWVDAFVCLLFRHCFFARAGPKIAKPVLFAEKLTIQRQTSLPFEW